jgi:competence protein ComEA
MVKKDQYWLAGQRQLFRTGTWPPASPPSFKEGIMKQLVNVLFLVAILVCGGLAPVQAAATASGGVAVTAPMPVNINTAAVAQLVELPGVGKATAERIIAYRTEHGPLQSVDDLVKVKGIGQKTLEKMRKMITVE